MMMMMMKGFLVNAVSLALIVLCWNVQDTVAVETRGSIRGRSLAIVQNAAAVAPKRRRREQQQQQQQVKEDEEEEDEEDGEEDETVNILNCFTNTLTADPAAIITSAALIGCFPDLVTGFLTDGGEAQSLQDVLSCVAAAVGCDDEQTEDTPDENDEDENNENDPPQQQPGGAGLGGILGNLGDIFDGSN
jgi:ribosomal protein L12E/L44/L45/RPP1/RPP2